MALEAYNPTTWSPGTPITQGRMENIEEGVRVNREALMEHETAINGLDTTIANRVSMELQGMTEGSTAGKNAWTQLVGLIGTDTLGNLKQDLASYMAQYAAADTELKNTFGVIKDQYGIESYAFNSSNTVYNAVKAINDALGYDAGGAPVFGTKDAEQNTITVLSTMNQLSQNVQTVLNALSEAAPSPTYTSLANRLALMNTAITTVTDAMTAAKTSTVYTTEKDGTQQPTTYGALSERLDHIETVLSDNTIDIGALSGSVNDNYVKKADVRDNFTSTDTNLPLSAAKGKELRDMIGGTYDSSNTVTGAINTSTATAESNAKNYAKDYTDSLLGSDFSATDTVAKAISSLKDADDALDTRLKAAEKELKDAHTSSTIKTDDADTEYESLDARLEAIESHAAVSDATAAGIRTDLTKIATELAMLDEETNVIKDTNTKIDDLERDVRSFANELVMARDEDGALIETNTRVDQISYAISHKASEDDNTTGLTERLTAAEATLATTAATANAAAKQEDFAALKSAVENETSGLAATKVIADAAATKSSVDALTTRVKNLEDEPKSATEVVATLPDVSAASADKDYLVGPNEDKKYFYYKLIGGEWQLISGGGGSGSGNTSGITLTADEYAALDTYAENTDYYVLREDGYHHYRYIPSTTEDKALVEIEIGQWIDLNKIKRYNMATTVSGEGDDAVTYLNLYQYNYDEDNSRIDTERTPLTQIALPKGGGGASSGSINRLVRIGDQTIQKIVNGQVILRAFYSSWDSEGAESSSGTYTLSKGTTVIETGLLQSGPYKADLSTGWQEDTTGYYPFDVSSYCTVGNNTFDLDVVVNGTTITKSWTVTIIDLRLESDAPATLLVNATESYEFPYTPIGALTKVLHVLIDGKESTETLNAGTSGRPVSYTIAPQDHGAHTIEMYLTATIGGESQKTDSIVREYIWYDASNEDEPIILASSASAKTITAQQYSTVEIPYQVYQKGASIISVKYYLDDATTPFDSVELDGVNSGTLSYLASTKGSHKITIKVEDVSIDINLEVTELSINVSPVSGAIIDFDPTMLSNTSANRLPSWTVGDTTYKLTASNNFNWSTDASGGGYKEDVDGKCFVVKAGSYVDLDYPFFARKDGKTVLDNGAEMKIIFKTEAVRDINAVWFQNVGTLTEKTVGIQLGAHSGWLKTDKAVDTDTTAAGTDYADWAANHDYKVGDVVVVKDTIYICQTAHTSGDAFADDNWLKSGKIDTEVLATNSYLYFPYSEQDKIELDININQHGTDGSTDFIMSYEDGVPSKAYAYTYGSGGDGLYHNSTIRIGSDDCDVYIYRLRIYNKALGTDAILQNFIADGRDINEKITRYNRNCIYWDPSITNDEGVAVGGYFTSPSKTASLDPIKLAERMPDVKILMLDTPVFTTGKKNFVGGKDNPTTLRCIHAKGGKIYESRGDADNWFFVNGFHSGQGTTSDNYGQSARNVDFLFEVDGEHYPTKAKNMKGYTPSKDYVSAVYVGEDASKWDEATKTWNATREAEEDEICKDWKGDECKVSLTSTSVPNNYFNLKVNVASSENVNNALFQKRYDDFLVYNSPAHAAQMAKHGEAYEAMGMDLDKIKVKNSMEFVPALLFVREYLPDVSKHNEFQDTDWHFYALGNIGDSKKTDYTRAYDPDDMNEFTCENSDNNTNNGQFQSGVFMYQGKRAIETPYDAYDSTKTYKDKDIVVNDGVIQIYNGASWANAELSGWTDAETPYFAPFTAPNTMEYMFPITSSEWNVQVNGGYVNYKHYTLVTEKFDGDHSFEFRYACRGDYRDGDLINETAGQNDTAQYNLNHDVMLALYEWIVTATEEQYIAEAEEWFVKSAMEFFYAYTHYYTMMDNRAKNTFWHFAKTGIHRTVSRPVAALLHVYDELKDGEYVRTEDTVINKDKTYYTEYAFDLWAYDMDKTLSM